VSKRLGSPYRSGRSPHWVKVKNPKAPAVRCEAEEDRENNQNSRCKNPNHTLTTTQAIKTLSIAISAVVIAPPSRTDTPACGSALATGPNTNLVGTNSLRQRLFFKNNARVLTVHKAIRAVRESERWRGENHSYRKSDTY
jgi:hypothetical protein